MSLISPSSSSNQSDKIPSHFEKIKMKKPKNYLKKDNIIYPPDATAGEYNQETETLRKKLLKSQDLLNHQAIHNQQLASQLEATNRALEAIQNQLLESQAALKKLEVSAREEEVVVGGVKEAHGVALRGLMRLVDERALEVELDLASVRHLLESPWTPLSRRQSSRARKRESMLRKQVDNIEEDEYEDEDDDDDTFLYMPPVRVKRTWDWDSDWDSDFEYDDEMCWWRNENPFNSTLKKNNIVELERKSIKNIGEDVKLNSEKETNACNEIEYYLNHSTASQEVNMHVDKGVPKNPSLDHGDLESVLWNGTTKAPKQSISSRNNNILNHNDIMEYIDDDYETTESEEDDYSTYGDNLENNHSSALWTGPVKSSSKQSSAVISSIDNDVSSIIWNGPVRHHSSTQANIVTASSSKSTTSYNSYPSPSSSMVSSSQLPPPINYKSNLYQVSLSQYGNSSYKNRTSQSSKRSSIDSIRDNSPNYSDFNLDDPTSALWKGRVRSTNSTAIDVEKSGTISNMSYQLGKAIDEPYKNYFETHTNFESSTADMYHPSPYAQSHSSSLSGISGNTIPIDMQSLGSSKNTSDYAKQPQSHSSNSSFSPSWLLKPFQNLVETLGETIIPSSSTYSGDPLSNPSDQRLETSRPPQSQPMMVPSTIPPNHRTENVENASSMYLNNSNASTAQSLGSLVHTLGNWCTNDSIIPTTSSPISSIGNDAISRTPSPCYTSSKGREEDGNIATQFLPYHIASYESSKPDLSDSESGVAQKAQENSQQSILSPTPTTPSPRPRAIFRSTSTEFSKLHTPRHPSPLHRAASISNLKSTSPAHSPSSSPRPLHQSTLLRRNSFSRRSASSTHSSPASSSQGSTLEKMAIAFENAIESAIEDPLAYLVPSWIKQSPNNIQQDAKSVTRTPSPFLNKEEPLARTLRHRSSSFHMKKDGVSGDGTVGLNDFMSEGLRKRASTPSLRNRD